MSASSVLIASAYSDSSEAASVACVNSHVKAAITWTANTHTRAARDATVLSGAPSTHGSTTSGAAMVPVVA